jgi:hypothetical protein
VHFASIAMKSSLTNQQIPLSVTQMQGINWFCKIELLLLH